MTPSRLPSTMSIEASMPANSAPSLLDRLGRPLESLRLSVTDRCNLRCLYCMPEEDYVWLPREELLSFEELVQLVDIFTGLGVTRLRLTGGEPLLRQHLDRLVGMLARNSRIRDLALTTNGVLFCRSGGRRSSAPASAASPSAWTPCAATAFAK